MAGDTAPGSKPRNVEKSVALFETHRPHMLGVAYRMLSSVSDAEDVLQEAWLRWAKVDPEDVGNAEAFLTTVVGRLSLDHLRHAKTLRETYTGPWLPEPVAYEPDPARDPAAALELADSLSMALLVVLETLSPLERAAFVLREVFERPYPEVAATLGRTEPAVRQLVHRARHRVDGGHARYQVDLDTHAHVVRRFLDACQTADMDELLQLLAPDVVIVSDGGGQARAPRRPVHGRDNVARLLVGFQRRTPDGMTFAAESFNGALGIVGRHGSVPISAMAVAVADGLVGSLQLITNPDKLAFVEDTHLGIV